tara:strand:- start:129 stop:749 length:621 start_codon:yes stop_codon:yes gene_type:complete
MKKIYLLLPLLANISFADMTTIFYQSAEVDASNSTVTLEQDFFGFQSYNSTVKSEWSFSVGTGETDDAGTVTSDVDVYELGYTQYYADRTSEASPYLHGGLGFVSVETNANAAVALSYDASAVTIKGGYALVPETGFGYNVGAGLITTIYDEDPSNATVLDTETDFTISGSLSYVLENGLGFTAAIVETGDDSADLKSFIGIRYQF